MIKSHKVTTLCLATHPLAFHAPSDPPPTPS